MKKSYLLWLFIGLLLLSSLVAAQDENTELSEIYESGDFTINYPEDWELIDDLTSEIGIGFSIPIAGLGGGGEGFIIQREDTRIWLNISENDGDSALEQTQAAASEFAEGIPDTQLTFSAEYLINGREVAFVDLQSMIPQRFVTMVLDEDTIFEGWVIGVPSQFVAVMPTLNEVLNTIRLADDDSDIEDLDVQYILSETHNRDGEWSFDYPRGWETEEGNSYTLMVIPNIETSIGLSASTNPIIKREELSFYAEMTRDSILEQDPTLDYEIFEIEKEAFSAIQTNFTDEESDFAYTSIVAYMEKDTIITISVIGSINEAAMLTPIIENIIASVVVD